MLSRQLFWTIANATAAALVDGSTGPLFPTAEGEDYNEWANGQYCFADDTNYAMADYTNYPTENDFYNFNFVIPAGATIDGIVIYANIETNDTEPARSKMTIELSWNGGTTYTSTGNYIINTVRNAFQLLSAGSSSNTWGRTWSASELSNANFRMRGTFVDGGTNPYESLCDYITAIVYYKA